MITPGTLLLNKNDMTTWWLLVSYEVVEGNVRDVAWFNTKNYVILNRYTVKKASLTRAAFGNRYKIIEP